MKRINIEHLSIVNFKGIRHLDIDFDGNETSIRGANGTGKTTIFDAFTWLLFGKDSKGRTKFNLKTLDEHGEAIPQIPHEVSATLNVDGERIRLRRCWTEIWSTYRGSSKKIFDHNEGERYYNDVPCGDREFKEKIDAICDEARFRELTNPFYFTSQSKEYQRNALIAMVGDLSVEDVIATDPKTFGKMLDYLSGKSLDEFEREIACHKKRVKSVIADLEPRIDEKMRDLSGLSVEDWKAVESAIKERENAIADIDTQIADIGYAFEAASSRRTSVLKQIADLRDKFDRRQLSLRDELLSEYRKAVVEYHAECNRIDSHNADNDITRRTLESRIAQFQSNLLLDQEEIQRLEEKRAKLLSEYRNIMSSEFDDTTAICPTCHRPLDEQERLRLEESFIEEKQKRLDINKSNGMSARVRIDELKDNEGYYLYQIEQLKANIEALQYKSKDSLVKPEEPDITEFLKSDEESLRIKEQIESLLHGELSEDVAPADTSELMSKKRDISGELVQLRSRLAVRDEIARTKERISELEKALETNRTELESYNELEQMIFNFNRAKMELLENKINAMFRYVKFKMYNRLNNGELSETCECTIDGVPFSDLNNAATINAGLDIINAICRVYDMCAPIFIDNRESVTSIIPTCSQIISLIVDAESKTLDIQ